jgi:hypothetical protein
MTPRQLGLIVVAFAALLLLWGAAALLRRAEGADATLAVLPAIPRDAVDTVVIARPRDTTVLARLDSTTWSVNRHPADQVAVASLLEALADTPRRGDPVAERPASHPGLGVDSTTGSRVRVIGRGGVLADLVAGRRSPDFDGGYLRRTADSTVYLVRGRLAELLERATDDWRDRRMGGVPADSVMSIEVGRGGRSYRLARSGGRWSFAGPRPAADSAAVSDLLGGYARLEAAGFATPAQADSARFDPADRRVRLLRGDGSPLLTLVMDSTAGGFWARVDTIPVVYRLERWTGDRLAPADSGLRARPHRQRLTGLSP